jgi:hypothetical protein
MGRPRPTCAPPRTRPGLAAAALLGISAVALGWLASCGDDPEFPFDDAACETALKGENAVAADAWLKDPYGGEKHLGSWSTDQGLALYHELEARGAERVVAVGVSKRPGREPAQEAVGLVAQLPDDPLKRRRLFEMHARQVRSAGYRPRADKGQRYLLFGWKTGASEGT